MRGTVRLFRLFGINVYLHWSFIFLILFLMYSTYSEHQNVRSFFKHKENKTTVNYFHLNAGKMNLPPDNYDIVVCKMFIHEVPLHIEHIGEAARESGAEIDASAPQHANDATRHVFAAMVPGAFHHGQCA